jgi:hypothetical protein
MLRFSLVLVLNIRAIRTSHPDRQSCTQCHAPDAGYDQREFLKTTFP